MTTLTPLDDAEWLLAQIVTMRSMLTSSRAMSSSQRKLGESLLADFEAQFAALQATIGCTPGCGCGVLCLSPVPPATLPHTT